MNDNMTLGDNVLLSNEEVEDDPYEDPLTELPKIPKALFDHLNKIFPDTCPSPYDSERQIWMKAGARKPLDLLKNHTT